MGLTKIQSGQWVDTQSRASYQGAALLSARKAEEFCGILVVPLLIFELPRNIKVALCLIL